MALPACDVVILGGGPAGAAAALALRRRGIERVVLVEAHGYEAVRVGESLPPDTRVLLERLGVWEGFAAEGHEPCLGSCSSWGDDALGYNDFLFNPHGHGWHLDRRRFDTFLARRAVESGAELLEETWFEGSERAGDGGFALRLTTRGGPPQTIHARFVVDATGSRSRFARSQGARPLFHDQLGVVAGFLELPASSRLSRLTMLEAVEYGWWYAARLPGDRLAVAVASDPEIIKQASLHAPERWLAGLRETRHLGVELEGSALAGDGLVVRPAPSFVLDTLTGPGWLAAGDAASAYDPIASQGIHKALLDGLSAADAIAAHRDGDPSGLEGYRAGVESRFAGYLKNRSYFYGVERRWAAAPFWSRRRERESAS